MNAPLVWKTRPAVDQVDLVCNIVIFYLVFLVPQKVLCWPNLTRTIQVTSIMSSLSYSRRLSSSIMLEVSSIRSRLVEAWISAQILLTDFHTYLTVLLAVLKQRLNTRLFRVLLVKFVGDIQQWYPNFSNLQGKRKLVREIGTSKYRG